MAVKTGVVDENGPPAGIPTRLSRIKNKLVMLKTQGAASLLNEVSGKRDDDGLAPMPQSDLSLDLKKPRDFAISLLQPRENLDLLPFSRHQKLLTFVDERKGKPFLSTPSERVCTAQENLQGDPARFAQPFVIQGQSGIPDSPPYEGASAETEEEEDRTRRSDPYNRRSAQDEHLTVYCHSVVVQWATERVPDVPLDAEDFSEGETASGDDLEEEELEPRRVLVVTNPDPDPDAISRFFSKSASYNASSADGWTHGHLARARSNFLQKHVHTQKGINPHAPWMPSLFNPIRSNAPPKAWSVLEAPLVARLGDSEWRMKTPLGEGILRRASRLLCDNDGNDPRHCMSCKYDDLHKALLSASFRRQRAAQGKLYSYNTCRACFGRLVVDSARSSPDRLTSLSGDDSYDEALLPRPSVDADKLWAGPLIKGIDFGLLKDFEDDEGTAAAVTDNRDDASLRSSASPVDEDSDLSSADGRNQEETFARREVLPGDNREAERSTPEGSSDSDSDSDEDRASPTRSWSGRPNKRRRHSSSELVAPSGNEAGFSPQEAPGRDGRGEPTKDGSKGRAKGSTLSAGRAQKRPRRPSLPSSARSQPTAKSVELRKEKRETGLQAILDPLSLTHDDIRPHNGAYHCPLEGCTHTAEATGDLVRHLQSKRHATHTYLCLDDRCLQEFAREDSLRRHHTNARGKRHRQVHQRRVELGFPDCVRKELVEAVKKWVGETPL